MRNLYEITAEEREDLVEECKLYICSVKFQFWDRTSKHMKLCHKLSKLFLDEPERSELQVKIHVNSQEVTDNLDRYIRGFLDRDVLPSEIVNASEKVAEDLLKIAFESAIEVTT